MSGARGRALRFLTLLVAVLVPFMAVGTTAAQTAPPAAPPSFTLSGNNTDANGVSTAPYDIWVNVGYTEGTTTQQVQYRAEIESTYTVVNVPIHPQVFVPVPHIDTAYIMYARNCNSAGCSAWVGPLRGQTADLIFAPGNVRAGPATDTSVQVAWDTSFATPPGITITDNVVAYRAQAGCLSGCTYTHLHVGTASSATITGLTPGTTYLAYVASCNAHGCSPWSNVAVTLQTTGTSTSVPPASPTNPRAGTATSSSVQVVWDAVSGATSYKVAYRTAAQSTYTVRDAATQTSYTITGLNPNTTVFANVSACNASGCSAWSSEVALHTTDGTAPAAPTNLRAGTVTNSSVQVLWNDASGATNYTIAYRPQSSCTSGCTWTYRDAGNYLSYTITGLAPGTTVFVYVGACNNVGCSTWAGPVTLMSN